MVAVTVERDHQGQHGSPHRHFERVTLDQLEDLAHGRIEQARVDHQGEVENGKHQHHASGRELADAFEHHWADVAVETAEQGEQDRYQDQGDQRGKAFGHDQVHERNDHGEAEEGQHGSTPGVTLRKESRFGRISASSAARGVAGGVQRTGGHRKTSGITIVVVDWAGRGSFRMPWLTGLLPVVGLSYWRKLSASFRLEPGDRR